MNDALSRALTAADRTAGESAKRRAGELVRNELEGILKRALKQAITEAIAEAQTESPSENGRGGSGKLLFLGIGFVIGYLLAERDVELAPETYEEMSRQLRRFSGETGERIEPYSAERSEQLRQSLESLADQLDERATERRAEQRHLPDVGLSGPLAVLVLGSAATVGYFLVKRSNGDSNDEWLDDSESTGVEINDEEDKPNDDS